MNRERVDVNLLWCVPGEVGGSEQYLVRQMVGIAQQPDHGLDLRLHVTAKFAAEHRHLEPHAAFVVGPSTGEQRWRRIIDESTWLFDKTKGADLVHHGGGTAPLRVRRPYVLTIHDLQWQTFPGYFSRLKRLYLRAIVRRSAIGAAVVTVPSEFVRGTVIDAFGVDADRVMVVPHGYEPSLLTDVTDEHALRTRLGIGDGPVIVYPAITHPHKNHRFLIELMKGPWRDSGMTLLLVGGQGRAETDVLEAIASSGVASRIVRSGYVHAADRNGLLALAHAMVFPSEYEGFGAPLIEAMALGTPVICSNATCMPDIVGDAAVVRPLRVDAWADALDEVERRRRSLIADGHRRVGAFTSARSGEALLAAYRRALA